MTDQFSQSETPFLNTAVKNGLIIGVILIVISLVHQLAGLSSNIFISMIVGLLSMVLYAVAAYRAIKEHRDVDLGGNITLGRGFLTGWVAALVAGVVTSIFSLVYINFIDPSSAQEAMDAARELMEKFGAPEEEIEKAMKDAENRLSNPLTLFMQGFGTAAVIGAIASIIVAAMLKRDEPRV